MNGIIRIYDGTRHLILFDTKKHDAIYGRIRYLKSNTLYIFSHYFAKLKVDSYDSFPIEETSILHNVIIFIESVLNKDKNCYYYKIFLENCSYQVAQKQSQIFFSNIIIVRFLERKREIAKKKVLCSKKT